ncbi:M50 family metallopeptidase [Frigidibacter sp. SD6-1]|uniref:M50 family metallopeptidase n=1 Tax=Frigidibacter sp. SD6-1 TaxID=3032581 RepID=UPI0024DFAEDB|nr:M50 family metallopeptidase [Frigidibacter sp. SD6-1]
MGRSAKIIARVRDHWQLVALTFLVAAHWHTSVVLPVKILVVFFHELSHALAAWGTGGSVERITLSAQQGGLTMSRGGNAFLIATAGYLGSLLIGMVIFLAAVRTNADRVIMASLGLVLALVTAVYFREPFPLTYGGLGAATMLASAIKLGHHANDLILRVIGLTSLIYVPFDIFDDTIARSAQMSDARILAETFGGSTHLWGGLWVAASVAAIALCLRFGLGGSSNIPVGFPSASDAAAPRAPRRSAPPG